MGDVNQLEFARDHRRRFRGPCLEVGSRDYGSTQDLRSLLPGCPHVGVDLSEGPGVDVVADLAGEFEQVDAALGGRRFGTVFCLSVLEHCVDPFRMAGNIQRLLEPGGVVYVSVPFVWEVHAYPSDYWRFTPDGVRALFPGLRFERELCAFSTPRRGAIFPLDDELGRLRLSVSGWIRRGHYGRAVTTALARLARGLRIGLWLVGYRYLFPPVLVHMIGTKEAS